MIAGAMAYGSFSPPRYNPFGGKIDEIRVYNRALSASEIALLAPYSLPLKLGDFTAAKKSSGIQLNWETITEENTSHFMIEKSKDGSNWSSIGRVNAAGNSSDKLFYHFMDASPAPGTNFYRLKMTDIDGSYTYSRVVAIKNDASLITLQLFPNPVSDVLQVQVPSVQKENAVFMITDGSGKTVFSKYVPLSEGTNAISIPVLHLPKGSYYLSVDNKITRQTKQFIKQ